MHKKTKDRNQKLCFKVDTKEEKERKKRTKHTKQAKKSIRFIFLN